MPLSLTRSAGQVILLTGAATARVRVREVCRYHVVITVDEQPLELRAGARLKVAPEVYFDLSGVNGRQARIAITAPPSVHVLREELQQRHTVRRGRTGDYECSCGATWDYRDGVEHP